MAETKTAPLAVKQLRQLPSLLNEQPGFSDVIAALRSSGKATIEGVWGSSCALLAAELAAQAPTTLLTVCPQQTELDDFCDEFELFSAIRPHRFPAWETEPGERIIHDDVYGERLGALKQLLAGDAHRVLATSIESLLQPTPTKRVVAEQTRRIRSGERIDVEQMLKWFAEHRFHHTSSVELPGEFSHRGGILDVFAPDWTRPVRLELFDDEIESIRAFDIVSQRSFEKLDEIEITILEPGDRDNEFLASYLPSDTWVMLMEPVAMRDHGAAYLGRLENPTRFHSVTGVFKSLERFSMVSAVHLAEGSLGAECRMPMESVERFAGDVSKFREELQSVAGDDDVYIVSNTEAESERLREIFGQQDFAARLQFVEGALRTGFRSPRDGYLLIGGGELFHRSQLRRPSRRRLGKAIDSFLDLREGDLVVHLAHGVGRYRGLELINKDGHVEEHLGLEFRGGTKVYVPAAKIDLVQKYIGGAKSRPTLAKIGGTAWVRHKKAAEAAVNDLASEMLELQASRELRPGISFSTDTDWQREFDASFPYEETADQRTAIVSIKSDMQSAKPMDRLLCGDVGFGKTELAMRGAFKAIENGYQVAVLVPTTILAEQHFRTFGERMAEFPIDVGKLSRFCSPKEQRETIAGLAAGRVDVVIGTHRLASKDVSFFNLGLVIIDEEQRFGVEVKERLKSFRNTVDVLTMSATPIPRTLHMSLVGVRDISNLETPPEDRMAVETRVTRFDSELIRRAILRELNRGGQVYFVHNRVQDIDAVCRKLREIVPEADIRIGHGQMNEHDLAKVMVDFVNGRFDVLLATTIVESGLDIPNANTIFIDEADRYGLADLHQLRGRVGRYKHRAYCYLLVDPHKHLSPSAAKRLRAIEEYSDMGAGFSISMRDLEIRGAGNLLGTQQSGHIAAVGYELYCQLLETAVRHQKKMPPKISLHVDVDLPGEAYLPTDYIPDMRMKIDFYRRLSRLTSFGDLRELREELVDRFGPLPQPAVRVLALAELKMEAAVWQIASVSVEERFLTFRYTYRPRIEQLAARNRKKLRIVDDSSAYLPIPEDVTEPDQIFDLAKSVLQPPS